MLDKTRTMKNSITSDPIVIGLFCSKCIAFIPHRIQFWKVDENQNLLYFKTCKTCSLEEGPISVDQTIWKEITENSTKEVT